MAKPVSEISSDTLRLQKFLAEAGLCSRRAAEEMITAGEVAVNGKTAILGQKVDPDHDRVTVRGKLVRVRTEIPLTLAVNKPRGLICSNDDPYHPVTIFTVLPPALARRRFFCAGRLDQDSEGLVILTTDGDLAHRLMHPSNEVIKRYEVTLETPFPAARIPRLVAGITMEGERLQVERATLVKPGPDGSSGFLDVQMHHGKKREIRRLFAALGYEVRRLRRYQIGALQVKGIPLRGMKQLSKKEIEMLFSR